MLDLEEYMKRVGVSKKSYVDEWIDLDLIPGAERDEETNTYSFLDSSRRPYRKGSIKAGMNANRIRTHIVKAAIARRHVTANTFFMSNGEFDEMVEDLIEAGLIRIRIEDGIKYYDSTRMSDDYANRSFKELGNFVQGCLKAMSEGAWKAVLDQATGPVSVP